MKKLAAFDAYEISDLFMLCLVRWIGFDASEFKYVCFFAGERFILERKPFMGLQFRFIAASIGI